MFDESTKHLARIRQSMQENDQAGKMSMWTVYEHPADYPKDFVARLHEVDATGSSRLTGSIIIAATLETLRYVLCFELNLTRRTRDPSDDTKVIEVWL